MNYTSQQNMTYVANRMIKRCKTFFNRKATYDFDVFFNAESIDCLKFHLQVIFYRISIPNFNSKNSKHFPSFCFEYTFWLKILLLLDNYIRHYILY